MGFPVPSVEKIQKALNLSESPAFVSKGGFKAVYKAKLYNGYEEAIKAVFISPSEDYSDQTDRNSDISEQDALLKKQLTARAFREIEALSQKPSSYLVHLGSIAPKIHCLDGCDYLIYSEEFLSGDPLSKWLEERYRPSFEEVRLIFVTLVKLIRDLVSIGYLHRDIKPDNIMNTGNSERPFVLLDLGIAYKMHATELTQGGSPPGTLRYMAPELLKPDYKEHMGFRSDLYAAALTVYVLASGKHPFAPRPESMYATAYRILNSAPDPLTSLRPDFPTEFCSIIDRCIRKRPALRYGNLEQLESDLGRIKQ